MSRFDTVDEVSGYRTIHNIVVDNLRQAIINGSLKPGERVSQDEVAAKYNISRMPVREAIRTLEAEGYVKIYPHRGIVVTELKPAEIEEIFAIRMVLEALATRLSAQRITAEYLAQLKRLLEEMESAQTAPIQYLVLNQKFHDVIFQAAGRPRLHALAMNLRNVVEPYLRIYLSGEGRMLRAHDVHKALFEALSNRDADRAEQLAKDHLAQALDALSVNLPQIDELSGDQAE